MNVTYLELHSCWIQDLYIYFVTCKMEESSNQREREREMREKERERK